MNQHDLAEKVAIDEIGANTTAVMAAVAQVPAVGVRLSDPGSARYRLASMEGRPAAAL